MGRSFDLSETDHLLTTTRSVRKRLDLTAPVDLDEIQECIAIACQAPTGGNVQDWRWLVVTDQEKRAKLAELYNRAGVPYFAANRKSVAERGVTDMDAILDSAEHLAAHLHEVPVHIVPCIFGRPEEMDTFTLASWYGRIYPAVWNLILALRTRGYGTTLTTLHLPFESEAAEALGIPATVHQAALLPVAKFTGEDFKAGQRKAAESLTYWDSWKGARADNRG
ncbi:MAG: nitroreductase family protein [Acidimicrobiales bacterium]|nr:nitroreductase family protein [Acidimicrobiales bacterium]